MEFPKRHVFLYLKSSDKNAIGDSEDDEQLPEIDGIGDSEDKEEWESDGQFSDESKLLSSDQASQVGSFDQATQMGSSGDSDSDGHFDVGSSGDDDFDGHNDEDEDYIVRV
ncbi:hypothetical protein L2E82_49735 [Cichorium intybus]|uniref:Uncharacterized protein n=1 Tax=Cichorium intybus TaxID=13427 RepID=A0ACB8Z065_CICIN|nr:hypothetical protein L2E82_49735 [Cichorium intybus]